MGSELENLSTVMSLIRDNQFGEAWEFLESLLVTDPGQVAQWYLFSRFLAQDEQRFGEEIRGVLGGMSRAATRGFESILKGLEAYDLEVSGGGKEGQIERLETFLQAMQMGSDDPVGGKAADLEPLLRFLEWARRGRVMQLDPVRAVERRLDGLRRRMQEGSAMAPAPLGGHHLAERLLGFGDLLGGKGKKDVRRV